MEEHKHEEKPDFNSLLAEVEKYIEKGSAEDVTALLICISNLAFKRHPDNLTIAVRFKEGEKAKPFIITETCLERDYRTQETSYTICLIPEGNKNERKVSLFKEELEQITSNESNVCGFLVALPILYKECFKKGPIGERLERLSIMTMAARDLYKQFTGMSLADISNLQVETYHKKNADYGDSFKKSMDEDGILVAKIRIGDKIRRIETLTAKGGKGEVKDERVQDTLLDLANYCVMTILWLKEYGKDLNY